MGSLIGFCFSCWLSLYNTKWSILNNVGYYSSYSYDGYYGGHDSFGYNDDGMSVDIAMPGLLAVEAFLSIGE